MNSINNMACAGAGIECQVIIMYDDSG